MCASDVSSGVLSSKICAWPLLSRESTEVTSTDLIKIWLELEPVQSSPARQPSPGSFSAVLWTFYLRGWGKYFTTIRGYWYEEVLNCERGSTEFPLDLGQWTRMSSLTRILTPIQSEFIVRPWFAGGRGMFRLTIFWVIFHSVHSKGIIFCMKLLDDRRILNSFGSSLQLFMYSRRLWSDILVTMKPIPFYPSENIALYLDLYTRYPKMSKNLVHIL